MISWIGILILIANWVLGDSSSVSDFVDYYQDYSYVINTKLNFDTFKEDVTNLVHPAGTKMFYNKLHSENLSVDLSK